MKKLMVSAALCAAVLPRMAMAEYSDDYITSSDDSVIRYVRHSGVAYAFTNTSAAANFTLKGCKLVEVLVVGGGGAGGSGQGGGGGAGGVIHFKPNLTVDGTLAGSVNVGTGGVHGVVKSRGGEGAASTLTLGEESWVAYGGSGGGGSANRGPLTEGGPFGSAGGAGANAGTAVSLTGSYTASQGSVGGTGSLYCGGGGGGAMEPGMQGLYSDASYGVGGNGLDCDITGVSHCYGSGGGGGGANTGAGDKAGGKESGGAGAPSGIAGTSAAKYSGVNGMGGGGGGTRDEKLAGNGGSGVVILYVLPKGKSGFQARLRSAPAALVGAEARVKPVVEDIESGARLVEGTHYSLAWANNTSVGATAQVAVTGLGDYLGSGGTLDFVVARPRYVKPDGSAEADGLGGWESATTLAHAIEVAEAGDEILALAGDYPVDATITTSKGFILRGGFAGTESYAYERAEGSRSVIDGGKTVIPLSLSNGADAPVTMDGIAFVRSWEQGLLKTGGAGDLTILNCRFHDNGWRNTDKNGSATGTWQIYWMYGAGLSVKGGRKARLAVFDSLVDGNCTRSAQYPRVGFHGVGAYVADCLDVTMENCLFATNGSVTAGMTSRYGLDAAALYVSTAPIRAKGCRFIGNRSEMYSGCRGGGIVALYGNSSGSSFENCSWIGNCVFRESDDNANHKGALLISLGDAARRCTLDKCTFAYNVGYLKDASFGLTVEGATATIRNSIFYGNIGASEATAYGADLTALSGAAIDIDYSWLSSEGGDSCASPGTLTRGGHMHYGDPLLVTSCAAANALLSSVPFSSSRATGNIYYKANVDFMSSLDVHLKSTEGRWNGTAWVKDEVSSEALDKGEPAASCGQEPAPNGGCVNLGVYGNTVEASMTPNGRAVMTLEEIDQAHDYSQPHLTVGFGGEAAYQAKVIVCSKVGAAGTEGTTEGWDVVRPVRTGVAPGETLSFGLGDYFLRGDNVYWQVLAVSAGGTAVLKGASPIVIENDRPSWYAASGGSKVIHVWAARAETGAGTGEGWRNACPSLTAALGIWAQDPEKTEIWIAEDLVEQAVTSVARALTIRGGFAGGETTAAARPAGSRTIIAGDKKGTPLTVSGAGTVTLDRLCFREGYEHGFVKSGAGSLTAVDCDFRDNGWRDGGPWPGVEVQGIGAQFTGTATATLVLSNCTFCGNQARTGELLGRGSGAYVGTFARVTMDDCSFLMNGIASAGTAMQTGGFCAGLHVLNAPITARNCRFAGNMATPHGNHAKTGGIMHLIGNCNGSAFTNCAWVGNTAQLLISPAPQENATVFVQFDTAARTVDFVNCTVAYNALMSANSSAGIEVACGTVTIRNSILYGNITTDSSTKGADLNVAAGSSATVSYSLLTAQTNTSYSSAGTLATDNVIYGNPYFVTEMTNVVDWIAKLDKVVVKTGATVRVSGAASYFANLPTVVETVNLHLRGRKGYVDETTGERVKAKMPVESGRNYSPAIDAGDETADYRTEPMPNGHRVNLGCYGNTPWSSMSTGGLLILVR